MYVEHLHPSVGAPLFITLDMNRQFTLFEEEPAKVEKVETANERKKFACETIFGQAPSKSNCYRIITISGHASLAKSKALKEYEQSFFMQCRNRGKMIDKRFALKIDVFYASDRPDLDNSLKIVLDCLQSCKVIKNDRLCAEIFARKLIDKKEPRIYLELEELL